MKNYKNILHLFFLLFPLLFLASCQKFSFLDAKPSSSIELPTTLADFQSLLDNTNVMTSTGGLAQLASDDYEVSYANWQTVSATQRNSYIWAEDIYGSDVGIQDWNNLYTEVFYANAVLDGLKQNNLLNTAQGQYLKGWALFVRAYAFYDLTRNFCNPYDAATAATDLGIPLRLTSGINYIVQRSTLQVTYNQILGDLATATPLLPSARPSANLNRPSQIAAYALLARINLDMRNYTQAETYAQQSLLLYSALIDYNTLSTNSNPYAQVFSQTNDELIYNTNQVIAYLFTETYASAVSTIPASVINLYAANDLRLQLYFFNANGVYTKKPGYFGEGFYPFTGLATDEMYLIKSECLARAGQTSEALATLNQLLVDRYPSGTFVPVTAASSNEALSEILAERRKELIWRGLRWHDLERLNKEGANITLSRTLNGVTYTIPPNDPRYVFPIPNDEIALSGIKQNVR